MNVGAYNWGKANTVLHKKKKKKHKFLSVSANALSATQEYISSPLNWALIVFQSRVASVMICMKNAFCGGNDDPDPGGDDRRDRIMTLWGANVL